MTKRKKRFPFGLLFVLIALFLAGVGYLGNATKQPPRKVWIASVHNAQRKQADVRIAAPELAPVPPTLPFSLLPPKEAMKNPLLAMNIVPALPKHVRHPSLGSGKIAIVIDDLGLHEATTRRAIALPALVTLSFLPYGKNLGVLTAQAKGVGHELLLHMPMEPLGREKPGPGALYVAQSPDEIRARLEKAFESFSGFDGVNNHMGSRFTADRAGMEVVAGILREKNLFFLDSYTSGKSIGAEVVRAYGVPAETRTVFLDDDPSLAAINAQLARTELLAKRHGLAIAIGHPNSSLLLALEQWIPEAQQQGYDIVPVRDVVW